MILGGKFEYQHQYAGIKVASIWILMHYLNIYQEVFVTTRSCAVCACVSEKEALREVREHKARVARARREEKGPIAVNAASRATPTISGARVKLPPIVVQVDDIGKITRRKVPVVRPIVWNVWDPDAPSYAYETLGLFMRDSLFPGTTAAENCGLWWTAKA